MNKNNNKKSYTAESLISDRKNFWIFCIELGLAILGIFAASGCSDIAIPILLKEKHIADVINSINYALYLSTYTAGCLLIIPLLKRYSSRSIVSAGVLGFLISLLVFSSKPTVPLLVSCYAIQGICGAIFMIIFSNIIIIASKYQKNEGLFIGVFISIISSGYLFGVASTGLLKTHFSLNLFFIMMLLEGICCIPILFSKTIHLLVDLGAQDITAQPLSLWKSIKRIIQHPVCFFAIMMFSLNDNLIIGLIPVWSLDRGSTPIHTTILLCLFLLGGVFFTSLFSTLSNYLSPFKVAFIYFLALLISIFSLRVGSKFALKTSPPFECFSFLILLLLVMGGVIDSFHSLYFRILTKKIKGILLVEACMLAAFLGHLVAAIESPICGYFMTLDGYRSFGIFLIVANVFFFLILLFQVFAIHFKQKRQL